MFNLLVAGDESAWQGHQATYELDRCVREHTAKDLVERFAELDSASVKELMALPAIFAYEKGVGKDPKFGRITQINKRLNRQEVRLDYELIPLPKFLTNEQFWGMGSELDLGRFEQNRTHWAVKDVDLMSELLSVGVILPPGFSGRGTQSVPLPPMPVDIARHNFDVAFSFPGEYRSVVEAVAAQTSARMGPHAGFYDNFYQSQLARPGLDVFLQSIYRNRSRLIVVFIGGDYQRKMWCGIEWSAIRSIITSMADPDRVMFVRMDDGQVDGIFPHDGFIDGRRFNAAQIAQFIFERVHILKERSPGQGPG